MRKRVLASAVLTMLLTLAPQAQAANKECGVLKTDNGRFAVDVTRGNPSCKEARRVLRIYFNGGGERHDGPSSAESYVRIGKWRCGSGTGGGGCTRDRRDRILGQACNQPERPCSERSSAPRALTSERDLPRRNAEHTFRSVLPYRLKAESPEVNRMRCTKRARRRFRCTFEIAEIDTVWKGTATLRQISGARWRYTARGSERECAGTDCVTVRRFTLRGTQMDLGDGAH